MIQYINRRVSGIPEIYPNTYNWSLDTQGAPLTDSFLLLDIPFRFLEALSDAV
jgi:hypothetical protein